MDFIAQRQDCPRLLIQVCESLANPSTRKRELAALEEAMAELDLPTGIIVTRHEEEQVTLKAGTVEVIPVGRFLLYNA